MRKLFSEACLYIPGGVNSPVRSFQNVINDPIFIESAEGSRIFDVTAKSYIDLVCSWGTNITGHANPIINQAIHKASQKGVSFGAVTTNETAIARQICRYVKAIEKIRLVNSGTEACMSAIRLARGYTGRKYIIKFEGCYHGHTDSLLVKAGSGASSFGAPDSAGVPQEVAQLTITLPYNDTEALYKCVEKYGIEVAAVIIEPIAGNMNMVPADVSFLRTVRNLCSECDMVLIFDEVMTGFRVALGGAQSVYDITPDIVCLGKVIGGGMPIGAFGGKAAIMELLAPLGDVYQAGTLSGNPVATAAGLAALSIVSQKDFYQQLEKKSRFLIEGLISRAKKHNIPFSGNFRGGMIGMFFAAKAPTTFTEVKACDVRLFHRFFHILLKKGVYIAPSMFEAGFISAAHTKEDLETVINIADSAFGLLR